MTSASPAHALVVLRQSGSIADEVGRERAERWAIAQLDADPNAGAMALVAQWNGYLDAGATTHSPMWLLPQNYPTSAAIGTALDQMLAARPTMPVDPLRLLLVAAARHLPRERFAFLADAALFRDDLSATARALWSLVVFAIRGEAARAALDGHPEEEMHAILDDRAGSGLLEAFMGASAAERASRDAAVVRLLGSSSDPEQARPRTGRVLRTRRNSDAVHRALQSLQANSDPSVPFLLDECLAMPGLNAWVPALRHAKAAQARLTNEIAFRAPDLDEVLGLLAGKAPINAADLRAIVVDELRRLARALRDGADVLWQNYWNLDSAGRPLDPRIENASRNTTLGMLREPLKPYHITVMPEVARKNGTRVDIYVATGAGRNVPVEAKRHWHPDLWTAASVQLQGYASSEQASGFGVLLVFWFGADWAPTPQRSDGQVPTSAEELEKLLIADLTEELRAVTDVIVLDVARPDGGEDQKAFAKRMKEEGTPRPRRAAKKAGTRGEAAAGKSRSSNSRDRDDEPQD